MPEELELLYEAKKALKPYWQVRSRIEKMFGKSYAESSWGQRMITNLHQQMRKTNPEMNRYYQMFYAKT